MVFHAHIQAHSNTRTHTLAYAHAHIHMREWMSHQRTSTRFKVSSESCSSLCFNATCTRTPIIIIMDYS